MFRSLVLALCVLVSLAAAPANRPTTRPATTRPSTRLAAARPAPKRIVFVVDTTASMTQHFDAVKRNLGQRVSSLAPGQSFNIVTCNEDSARGASKTLMPATEANKRTAIDFINNSQPRGGGDPDVGLEAAFEQKPEEVWLYTDGDLNNWETFYRRAVALAKSRKIPINTSLAAMSSDDELGYIEPLIALARSTGGVCLDRDDHPIPADRKITFGLEPKPEPGVKLK